MEQEGCEEGESVSVLGQSGCDREVKELDETVDAGDEEREDGLDGKR